MGMVGLPRFSREIAVAVANAPASRRLTRRLLHPSTGWIAFALAFWVWHAPALFWRPVILTFSDRVVYPRYSPVDDQVLAGVIMWVPGSLPLLLPLSRLIIQLSPGRVVMEGYHA
jgi:cytochrome c oxidase assembly factor CtaG